MPSKVWTENKLLYIHLVLYLFIVIFCAFMSYLGKCKLWFGGVLHFLVRRTLFANTSEILCKYFALAGCILCRYLCRNDSGACKKFFYALSACVCAEIVNWGGGCFCHRLMPAKHGRYKLCTLQATRGLQIQIQNKYKYKLQKQSRTKCKYEKILYMNIIKLPGYLK